MYKIKINTKTFPFKYGDGNTFSKVVDTTDIDTNWFNGSEMTGTITRGNMVDAVINVAGYVPTAKYIRTEHKYFGIEYWYVVASSLANNKIIYVVRKDVLTSNRNKIKFNRPVNVKRKHLDFYKYVSSNGIVEKWSGDFTPVNGEFASSDIGGIELSTGDKFTIKIDDLEKEFTYADSDGYDIDYYIADGMSFKIDIGVDFTTGKVIYSISDGLDNTLDLSTLKIIKVDTDPIVNIKLTDRHLNMINIAEPLELNKDFNPKVIELNIENTKDDTVNGYDEVSIFAFKARSKDDAFTPVNPKTTQQLPVFPIISEQSATDLSRESLLSKFKVAKPAAGSTLSPQFIGANSATKPVDRSQINIDNGFWKIFTPDNSGDELQTAKTELEKIIADRVKSLGVINPENQYRGLVGIETVRGLWTDGGGLAYDDFELLSGLIYIRKPIAVAGTNIENIYTKLLNSTNHSTLMSLIYMPIGYVKTKEKALVGTIDVVAPIDLKRELSIYSLTPSILFNNSTGTSTNRPEPKVETLLEWDLFFGVEKIREIDIRKPLNNFIKKSTITADYRLTPSGANVALDFKTGELPNRLINIKLPNQLPLSVDAYVGYLQEHKFSFENTKKWTDINYNTAKRNNAFSLASNVIKSTIGTATGLASGDKFMSVDNGTAGANFGLGIAGAALNFDTQLKANQQKYDTFQAGINDTKFNSGTISTISGETYVNIAYNESRPHGFSGFNLIAKSFTDESALSLKNFTKLYGYNYDKTEIPLIETQSRSHFDFYQIDNALEGLENNMPNDELMEINGLLSNGVRFWHTKDVTYDIENWEVGVWQQINIKP